MRTLDLIVKEVNCKYGAPMGRANIGTEPKDKKVFDCYVPMYDAYDRGGAYWGLGERMRVSYTKDLSYIHFYREYDVTGFKEWMQDGNVIKTGVNEFKEQTTQWKCKFTLIELKEFFHREFKND